MLGEESAVLERISSVEVPPIVHCFCIIFMKLQLRLKIRISNIYSLHICAKLL